METFISRTGRSQKGGWKHVEVKKGDGNTSILKTTQNFLELFFNDGSSKRLEYLKNKDELFNITLAFSGVSWQQLPI